MAGSRLLICAAALATLAGPALAQVASSSGSQVVMDPETRRAYVVSPLDGDAYSAPATPAYQEPIVLKKPRRHKPKPKVAAAPPSSSTEAAETPQKPAAPPSSSDSGSPGADDYVSPFGGSPQIAAPPKPTRKKVSQKPKAPDEPAATSAAIPFSLSGNDNYSAPPPKLGQEQSVAAPPASGSKKAVGQIRNIHVNFAPGAPEPSSEVAAALASLAGGLTSELQEKHGRLLLQAFAGAPGDKSSDARRLSLKRALAVRQLLIDSGVPSDRIDVRAMGGITDGGKPDRVDVMLHT